MFAVHFAFLAYACEVQMTVRRLVLTKNTLSWMVHELRLPAVHGQSRKCAKVVSTATRNFHNGLCKNNNVFLASAELAAISYKLGQITMVPEYNETMGIVNKDGAVIYKTLNFNQIEEYVENAKGVTARLLAC